MNAVAVVPTGILLPESTLSTPWFTLLSVFVAINTVMYVALAVAKMLPKLHLSDLSRRHYSRSQTRSIHPDAVDPGRPARPPER